MTIYAVNGREPIGAWIPSLDTVGNGTSTAYDLTANARNGSLTSVSWVANTEAGGVRALSMSAGYMRLADHIDWTTKPISFSLWFKQTSVADYTLFHKGDGVGTDNSLLLIQYNGAMAFNLEGWVWPTGGGGWTRSATNAPYNDNAWHHVVFTIGSQAIVYVDGVLRVTTAFSPTINNDSNPLDFGFHPAAPVGDLNGLLDDIRIFGTVLNQSDVDFLYNAGSGRGILSSPSLSNRSNAMMIGVGL